MVVTLFRNRLKPDANPQYSQVAARMSVLAESMPGYISHKVFTAEDGERVTIVEFASEEAQRDWATHPEHLQAQALGRKAFYSEFKLQICALQRESSFLSR